MTVHELRQALEAVPETAKVVFQANIRGEESEQPHHTVSVGNVFSAFQRHISHGIEFVIDGEITDSL